MRDDARTLRTLALFTRWQAMERDYVQVMRMRSLMAHAALYGKLARAHYDAYDALCHQLGTAVPDA